ncbi:TetR/AcrR family transcriptional regulator [Streptomyces sp. NPDC057539]|uniref:TetR/AcrR family transcriptional regulator n=1 Tax=Streptomyces sp. NPDC057539 TaxID=3346159 RepID=UPI0036CC37F8
MARRSDAKQRMVQAAKELIQRNGCDATAFSDVLKLSDAPRGSVYFHFPGGKAQLVTEAAAAHAHEQVELIDRVADDVDSATGLVERYMDLGREGMVASDYTRGCAVAPLVTEGTLRESPEVAETSRRAFSEMVDRLAFHFAAFGVERTAARVLADAVLAGIEGAMVTSRALHSPAPYDSVRAVLSGYAAAVSPKPVRDSQ